MDTTKNKLVFAHVLRGMVFVISLAVYLLTLQQDVLPADSGEFQVVASQLGVAHPFGFPLYTMVGKLFSLLMPARPALGLNLMSAVLAAATLTLLFETVRRLAGVIPNLPTGAGVWGGLAAVLALGTSTTFWSQATTTNIRMPTMALLAWSVREIATLSANLRESTPMAIGMGENARTLVDKKSSYRNSLTRLALALSLGLGHYPPLAFVGAFLVLYLVLLDPRLLWTPRRWVRPLAAFAAGQLVWLYLPLRAASGAVFAPDDLATLQGFLYHVTARGFGGDMFAFAGLEYLPARLELLPTLLQFQFNPALLAASALGALIVTWRDWRTGLMLIGGWVAQVYITITYRAPQTVEYMMPAYLLQAIALGVGTSQLLTVNCQLLIVNSVSRFLSTTLAISILLAGLLNGIAHAPGYIQLAGDHSTRDYVAPILQEAPAGAVILADWHWFTPLAYLQNVEGQRPDVSVEYVYPLGGIDYAQVWLQRIEAEIDSHPVLVTRYSGVEYAASGYIFQPIGQAFRVLKQPAQDLPAGFEPVRLESELTQIDFEGQIAVAGYRLDRRAFQAGQVVELAVAWRPLAALDHDYSFTVHVLDAAGRHVAQRDSRLPARDYAAGAVYIERFGLPLFPELLSGEYTIVIGAYYSLPEGGWHNLAAGGQTLAALAQISLIPSSQPPLTLHRLDVPFEGGLRLAGVDYDYSDPVTLRVYLHWDDCRGAQTALVARLEAGGAVKEQGLPTVPVGGYFSTIHDLPAASTGVDLSVSLHDEAGRAVKPGIWGLAPARLALPRPTPGSRYVLIGEQLALTGVSASPQRPRPGGQLRLDLTFVARRSLVNDYSFSVRLQHREGAWWLPQDTKPALDTIRTLKWIAGSRVLDPHRFHLPADAASGWADAHLKVYDEFRQAILPPLDNRMGDSILLGAWEMAP
ncbi:MAG: DUF2723 domain-containing protein [Thermoflexales bacterium]|nr:DUF2723 domain-containing protein [Thermoflexales bacterium]